MGSRIRDNPLHVFEVFCEVGLPLSGDESAWILQKYPEDYTNEEICKSIPQFSHPCPLIPSDAVEHFSFVLTNFDSKWTFGYCRYAPNTPTCFVMLSYLPWHDTFFKVLNAIADLTNNKRVPSGDLWRFLDALYNATVPKSGMQLHVTYNEGKSEFVAQSPDDHKLPSIPQNRNLMEYFSAVSISNMIHIFASMLHERRILITSRKLSKLSACVQAANLLIYPMFWQHIFIPILPTHLIDYMSAPMPFLIGVPSSTLVRVRLSEIGDVVMLDIDNDKVESPFNDLEMMPSELVHTLKRSLKNPNVLLGDTVARAFLRAVVQLIGGYKDALDVSPGKEITFNREVFIKSRPLIMQSFLEKMLHLQIFHQFIEDRLKVLNTGQVCSDEFESEVNFYDEKSTSHFKGQYKEWASNMKREGGALLKTVKNKANPAMKHAYKNVKHKSRKVYKDFRSKIQEIQHQKDGTEFNQRFKKPHSAPASPILSQRPFTTHNPDVIPKSQTTVHHLEASAQESRHYNLLNLEDDDSDDSDSSQNLSMDRLNLDLMSDLQDIFQSYSLNSQRSPSMEKPSTSSVPTTRRELSIAGSTSSEAVSQSTTAYSLLNPPPIDRRLKPQHSAERSISTPPTSSSTALRTISPNTPMVKPIPIPPPRSKRRPVDPSNANSEALLINLEEYEPIFDPLLERDSNVKRQQQPDLLAATNGKTIWKNKEQLSLHQPVTRTDLAPWPGTTSTNDPFNPGGFSAFGSSHINRQTLPSSQAVLQANPIYFPHNPHNPFLPNASQASGSNASSPSCHTGRWTKLPDSNIWCNLSKNQNS